MKVYQLMKRIFISLICALMLSSVGAHKTYASQQQQQQTYKGKVVYYVTYPDNSEPIEVGSEEEAKKLVDEYKTKVLFTGTTDESGNIVLPGWFTEGEICIKETVIPEGYTAETTEKILDLSEKETTFVNKKKEEPKPVEEPKKEEPRPVSIPKTGIDSILKDLFDKYIKPFKEQYVDPSNPGTDHEHHEEDYEPVKEIETADFIIHKVDQDKKPLKGATFEVYGKPTYKLKVKVTVNKEFLHPEYLGPKVDIDIPYENDESENTIELIKKYYLESKININVVGNGFNETKTFELDNNTGAYVLEPGNYTISETTNLVGQPYNNEYIMIQFYLQSYEIEVKDNGDIVRKSAPQWAALQRDINMEAARAEYFMYPIDSNLSPYPYSVQMSADGITIYNYSFIEQEMCPPKCQ